MRCVYRDDDWKKGLRMSQEVFDQAVEPSPKHKISLLTALHSKL